MIFKLLLLMFIAVATAFQSNGATVSKDPYSSAVELATTAAVGPGATGAHVLRAQILLACARFSPGEIDGRYGDDLSIAIKGYQENHGLKSTGIIDAPMWKMLDAHKGPLLITYMITAADLKGPFAPIPPSAADQAKLKWMGYESVQEELGEKFQMSPKLLAQLNPGKKLDVAGESITVTNVKLTAAQRASRVVVSKTQRTVTAYGVGKTVLAQYPATIGGAHDPLPIGNWTITSVARFPWFHWDPVHYWNVDHAPRQWSPGIGPAPSCQRRRRLRFFEF